MPPRIRTVKPEVAMHEGLYELERETGLPVRFSWVCLFCHCDREGRFEWRPRRLGAHILPYDGVDFSRVLDALATRGFVTCYRVGHRWFGVIPTFRKHQVINNRELGSDLPSTQDAEEFYPDDSQRLLEHKQEDTHACPTRESRVDDPSGTREPREDHAGKAEGNGNGTGTERNMKDTHSGSKRAPNGAAQRFEEFWTHYPKKRKKKQAREIWTRKRLDEKAEEIIADVCDRTTRDGRWLRGYVPDPTTYLNGERWEDEIDEPTRPSPHKTRTPDADNPMRPDAKGRIGFNPDGSKNLEYRGGSYWQQ